jgi:hypothetical protein
MLPEALKKREMVHQDAGGPDVWPGRPNLRSGFQSWSRVRYLSPREGLPKPRRGLDERQAG